MKEELKNYKNLYTKGVYLDNAATSFPKPECVWESMEKYIRENGATSSRGAYKKQSKQTAWYMRRERRLRSFFTASDHQM